MVFLFAFLSATVTLMAWMYILTCLMQSGAGTDFVSRARLNVFRGFMIAAVLLFVSSISSLYFLLYRDGILVTLVFYSLALPYLWRRAGWISLLPFALGIGLVAAVYYDFNTGYIWGPFHEEVGKWLHSLTNSFPAAMSPFVGIGFSFLENIRYFSTNTEIGYMIARSLFSLPLHLFATFFGLYCFLSFHSRLVGGFVGLISAIVIHTAYNWSLDTSIFLTIAILISGYMFYGWSLENGWWKRKI